MVPSLIGIIALLCAVIVTLMTQRVRRGRSDPALLENEARGRLEVAPEREALLHASNQRINDLAGRLIRSQELERSRIARELHDDLSQQLAGLAIALSGLKRNATALVPPEAIQSEITSLQERALALGETIRRLSHNLHPTVLAHGNVVAVLSAHCLELQRRTNVVVSFTSQGDFDDTDPQVALCLFRVTQEALRNVVTHAAARLVAVKLVRAADCIDLSITDDGKGFDIAAARNNNPGLGLISMNERVRLAGGTVSVRTEMNRGTTVHVLLCRRATAA